MEFTVTLRPIFAHIDASALTIASSFTQRLLGVSIVKEKPFS